MDLRDHFAGLVLGGSIGGAVGIGQLESDERKKLLLQLASLCYEIADAMIEVRSNSDAQSA
jgi:hypothetical protein